MDYSVVFSLTVTQHDYKNKNEDSRKKLMVLIAKGDVCLFDEKLVSVSF
jgi:hypothetical protein